MQAIAIIGSNFGDEGKGVTVNRYATESSLVVRFNGGAQAGHTVTMPDGRSHVFHHVGSGALKGADTLLSRFFLTNPIVLEDELKALAALGCIPTITIDQCSPLTTPFDMIINQVVEQHRGDMRHGSCGVGINETMRRGISEHATYVIDMLDPAALRQRLVLIRDEWVPARLFELLGSKFRENAVADLLTGDHLIDIFMWACDRVMKSVSITDRSEGVMNGRHLVFEGAQGLLLDQVRGHFPFVTHSHTGIRNVLLLCRDVGIRHLKPVYVTRPYLTRHGAGPLPAEGHIEVETNDTTNIPNEWQGRIRYAPLNVQSLAESIHEDLSDANGHGISIEPEIAVTCLDQISTNIPMLGSKRMRNIHREQITEMILDAADMTHATEAWRGASGPADQVELRGSIRRRVFA